MSICGLVVHAFPRDADAVSAKLGSFDGVEVHAATPDGRLVVTIDRPDDHEAAELFRTVEGLPGVLSTTIAYSHCEQDLAEEE